METPVFSDRGNYLGESYYIGDRYRENIRAVFIFFLRTRRFVLM
jgi:hypothetical protein